MTPPEAIDLAALQRLAEKATPGPWTIEPVKPQHRDGTGRDNSLHIMWDDPVDARCGTWVAEIPGGACNTYARDNATYIAAANPRTVLALLDVLDALTGYFESHKHGHDCDIEEAFCDLSAAYDRAIAGQQQQEGT